MKNESEDRGKAENAAEVNVAKIFRASTEGSDGEAQQVVDRLMQRVPGIMARAAEQRQQQETISGALNSLSMRLVPQLVALSVVLAVACFVVGRNSNATPSPAAENPSNS